MVLIVRFDAPALRPNIPIHQFGTRISSPPRCPPWWLNKPYTTASCMTCHFPVSFGCADRSGVNGIQTSRAAVIHLIDIRSSNRWPSGQSVVVSRHSNKRGSDAEWIQECGAGSASRRSKSAAVGPCRPHLWYGSVEEHAMCNGLGERQGVTRGDDGVNRGCIASRQGRR